MYPTVCQCCGQKMKQAYSPNPNICVACATSVGESARCENEARTLLRFTAGACSTSEHAELTQVKAA